MDDFEGFFDREYPGVVHALGLAFGFDARIEDAAQEAFARAFAKWTTVGSMARPGTWVYVVAVRRLRRWHRRVDVTVVGARLPRSQEEGVVDRMMVEDLLARLAPRQRETVVLRYLAGLSIEETAEVLGCAPGTVKAATHRALELLRVVSDA